MKPLNGMFGLLLVFGVTTSSGQVLLTKDAALRISFPDSPPVRKTLFLSESEVKEIQAAARTKVDSRIVTYYAGKLSSGEQGYAFFETNVVRTMQETFMVILDAEGVVQSVELLAFFEPEDYRPPVRWLGLFTGATVRSDLWLKQGVQNIVGATLTAHAISDGVRKVLQTYRLAVSKRNKE